LLFTQELRRLREKEDLIIISALNKLRLNSLNYVIMLYLLSKILNICDGIIIALD